MTLFRLCRAAHPVYDGEGARRAGGRWNSKGTRVLYTSESRALAVLEILVHLSSTIPDQYRLGTAEFPGDLAVQSLNQDSLPENWATLDPREQVATRKIGDEWVESQRTAILAVPSVIVGERNYVLNPSHPDFRRITFADPVPFDFDLRLLRPGVHSLARRPGTERVLPD